MELCASVEPLLGSYPGPILALSEDSCGLQIESVRPRSRVAARALSGCPFGPTYIAKI